MNDSILIKDNFLNKELCYNLIEFFKKNLLSVVQYRDTFTYPIKEEDFVDLKYKINNLLKFNNAIIDWWQIVHWPENSFQDLHYDNASEKTCLTSISYLNNDYEGGQTYFEEGTLIVPKIGRTLVFNGQTYKHGVKKIIKKDRFTLAIWYKNG
jgi:hypothetical protein